ncbi:HK97 family phage prohead protease [Amycolatopsis sp. NPDC051903]|uniref:HK97 family phage prohead protease n=1 Tax=Amycolatopsis sp. NPDC051903 TaxID=3363936 RepID=UPI0037B87837
MTDLYRVAPDDFKILNRAQGGDGRTVVGRAVPYNVDQVITRNLTERFEFGAFANQLRAGHRIPFTRDHMALGGSVIGRTIRLEDREDGLYGEWRVSRTVLGDETLALLEDGALDQLSIGFRDLAPNPPRNGVTVRSRAHLIEVSVVLNGAYGENAAVESVRAVAPETPNLAAARNVLGSLPELPSW